MASLPLPPDAPRVTTLPIVATMPAVARILGRFDRDQLAGFIAVAIDLADALDGDADTESDGDADTESDGDDRDVSWTEWQSRGRRKNDPGFYANSGQPAEEDDEEDDVGEEDDWHGVNDEDGVNIGVELIGERPGDDIDAEPEEAGETRARGVHRDHIRLTRCDDMSSRWDKWWRLKPGLPLINGEKINV